MLNIDEEIELALTLLRISEISEEELSKMSLEFLIRLEKELNRIIEENNKKLSSRW